MFLNEQDQTRQSQYTRHGSIQNRDLAIEMCAQDWAKKYDDIWKDYSEQSKETQDLTMTLIKKQEMYIARE